MVDIIIFNYSISLAICKEKLEMHLLFIVYLHVSLEKALLKNISVKSLKDSSYLKHIYKEINLLETNNSNSQEIYLIELYKVLYCLKYYWYMWYQYFGKYF